MFFQLKSYLLFLLKSFNQKNNKHSFILGLKNNCFNAKTSSEKFKIFKKYKTQLLNNKTTIKITDFGAGSTVFSSDERQVSKIAKVAGISNKRAKLLIRLTTYFQPKEILEIGTSLGLATSALAANNKNTAITTLEGCPETAKIAQQQFTKFGFNNISLKVGDFAKTLPKAIENKQFNFIYFDGNHQKEATLHYFEACLKSANENTVFIFDDIYWSKEMLAAWALIKKHPKVSCTVDTFQWGFVFFNQKQINEHYTIRI
ncbi:O-methyltransferase [Tenacibaculum aquimarinum]|uniref:O-methyltransferase n=1 Tax=Tenacibaculum aquimarinum TaxID=2910675 RepID=UPI001F0A297E|nr:class I SAM-dependent methyltransferase [Tenacibaculum aquimarinum]MCH3882524.1 class I SAM-dependent methyltransferase [Tenacibaculum aquimarinum]